MQHNQLLRSALSVHCAQKNGAIPVVSAMLTSVRHNTFVLWPTEPDPDDTANMEQ